MKNSDVVERLCKDIQGETWHVKIFLDDSIQMLKSTYDRFNSKAEVMLKDPDDFDILYFYQIQNMKDHFMDLWYSFLIFDNDFFREEKENVQRTFKKLEEIKEKYLS